MKTGILEKSWLDSAETSATLIQILPFTMICHNSSFMSIAVNELFFLFLNNNNNI